MRSELGGSARGSPVRCDPWLFLVAVMPSIDLGQCTLAKGLLVSVQGRARDVNVPGGQALSLKGAVEKAPPREHYCGPHIVARNS